tara:strand:+ start:400 stop:843 length:444 start_codon:yes stop_codon:yes gene_type:complete
MQASDDFTKHTQSMIDTFHSCKNLHHIITNQKEFVEIFNPSTQSYETLDVDVLKSDDGVFHVAISLPAVDLLDCHVLDDELAFNRQKVDQEIIVNQVKKMFDDIHEIFTTDEGYEVSWFACDREDAYENYQGVMEGEGLMVVVLKPI